ncbi:hypothetical protein FO519_005888 [Halicephalobus sp. NKZ332]|nr:hypothetical protein FO519_005888 [Halicephalobus sp. NKZ332]
MASRICVGNLPPRLYDENAIRKMFKEFGEITDISLPGKNSGKKTGLAFVGFPDKSAAASAISKKNGTFAGTVKISVTEARSTVLGKRPAENVGTNPRKMRKQDKVEDPEPDSDAIEKITKNGRLLLRNLAHCCTEDNLRELIGDVATKELRCLMDHQKGICTGIAYVQYAVPDEAVEAFKRLHKSEFMGRYLQILPCDDRKETNEKSARYNTKAMPYVPKSRTDHGSRSWNALFLGGDTVAEVFSKKLEIQKSELLTGNSNLSPIVALSLAEMRILREIREFLLQNNVNIYSFEGDIPRSRKVIIVKNLPHPISGETVKKTFMQFGEVRRFVFNEEFGMTAIIEFTESSAQKAFESMNGAMYKRRPLKLEFAPETIFDKPPSRELINSKIVKKIVRLAKEHLSGDGINVSELIKSTVLITFTTNDVPENYDLRSVFLKQRKNIIGCEVLHEQTPKSGFILYRTSEAAEQVVEDKKVTLSREEILSVEIASEESIIAGERSAYKTLLVRNLPFTVRDDEVRSLMQTVGPLKEIRLPESLTGGKRGFGFVEFANAADVHKALEMFEGVHFSGRRMVIEMTPKTVVSPEDQKKINTFARLYDKERQLKAEIDLMKKICLDLEDAELAILEVDEGKIPFKYGLAFISEKSDDVSSLVEKRQEEAKLKQRNAEIELEKIKTEMSTLRTELYATFGDNISLEADEEN